MRRNILNESDIIYDIHTHKNDKFISYIYIYTLKTRDIKEVRKSVSTSHYCRDEFIPF